ncbi:Lipin/Ned1/Smp2-domain-containing protein [Chlamydoabsidia padenii]|nr:Lipin/Ned1/Smp2-domain-containing protein [Chlamydoabsidia padenii]
MKVGEAGESFFVFETEHEVPEEFQTSPIVGAVVESKTDEEPPFLDIGESKNQTQGQQQQDTKDQFEDDDTDHAMRLPLPAELQSPKMIIEEQMDKVVTNMDPYSSHHHHQQDTTLHHDIDKLTLDSSSTTQSTTVPVSQKLDPSPQNDVYPMEDGSTLLERVIPEAITTTTIAKETFIVRPANGDIYSKVMDVSHRSVHRRDGGQLLNTKSHDSSNNSEPISISSTPSQPQEDDGDDDDHRHNESIVLDISGYKTGERGWEERDERQNQVNKMILSKLEDEMLTHDIDGSMDLSESGNLDLARAESPEALDNNDIDTKDLPQDASTLGTKDESNNKDAATLGSVKPPTTGLWGWGNSRRKGTNESIKSDNDNNDDDDDETSIGTDTTKATDVSQVTVDDKDNKQPVALKYQLIPGTTYRIEMSLCGLSAFGSDEKENATVFDEHQITYDTFMHNPNLLNDKRLVFRYERRYFAAGNTGPLFTSLLLYKKPLQEASAGTEDRHSSGSGGSGSNVEDSRESYLFGKGWRQWLSRSSVAAPSSSGGDSHSSENKANTSSTTDSDTTPSLSNNNNNSEDKGNGHEDVTTTFTTTTKTTTVGWNAEHNHNSNGGGDGNTTNQMNLMPRKNYAKTLRLTSEQLKQLHLNKGVNTISFSVSSAYQGTATCAAKIFYWDYDMPIVISDIDGTITKSDALGHVFTMIGKDWTHHGVAKLYTDICNNGYKILYLTSRAIGQADYTRDYLKKVEQGNYQLPDGPVIMSPDRLFTSFHREVIMRKPEVFKMACLKDIQRLFGGRDPFYAGFGNRITDAISYRSVNVPASRIFTIDPYGDIKLELLKGFTSSYIHLNDLVDQIFPPVNTKTLKTDEEFNDWNFWKQPLPEIDLPVTDTTTSPPTSPKPKPIKPDLSSLPSETIATTEKQQQSKSGLLRSLTSMSTSSSSSIVSDRQQSPPPRHASPPPTSTPSVSLPPSGERSRVHSFTTTLRRPSFLLGTSPPASTTPASSTSTPATLQDSPQDVDEQQPPLRPTSPGLMNQISNGIGGVRHTLSRTFAYGGGDTKQDEDHVVDEPDELDDDEFDASLDNMDDIPFI